MIHKYLLMVGNGFTLSYIDHCGININSSKPFDHQIDCPFSPKESLLDCLPELKRLRTSYENETDFDVAVWQPRKLYDLIVPIPVIIILELQGVLIGRQL